MTATVQDLPEVAPRTAAELQRWSTWARTPRLRTMEQFAEQEIVLPNGPCAERRFKCHRQPYSRLFFQAVDSGQWRRVNALGPTQSGKTLTCFTIPALYHLFEIGETVVCGVPNLDMVADKWLEDILPVVEATRYRELLPDRGASSRGGNPGTAVRFKNGATLRFMTGGAGDKGRAGFTTRVVVITETDGMDESSEASDEADKITQLEARTRSFDADARIYLECTVTTKEGRTWREYEGGTKSRIAQRCPRCLAYVTLEREHLVHWEDAENKIEAAELARWACPACGDVWDEEQRAEAARANVLVHDGQEVAADGSVTGPPPQTDTLGFRWSAPDNLFLSASFIASDEWSKSRQADEDNAEKALCQIAWALPYEGDEEKITELDLRSIMIRTEKALERGRVPADTQYFTAAIDLGKWLCNWEVVAWRPNAAPHVVDYDRIEVPAGDLGIEHGLEVALNQFKDLVDAGWPGPGGLWAPSIRVIDSGWQPDVVYRFCRDNGALKPSRAAPLKGWVPMKGWGQSQEMAGVYRKPTRKTTTIRWIGPGYHISKLQAQRTFLLHADADQWKTFLHARLMTPMGQSGAMTLFAAQAVRSHLAFAKHLTAERQVQEYLAGKGYVTEWRRVSRNNHWLDASWLNCVAAHLAGARLVDDDNVSPGPSASAGASWYRQQQEGRRR